MFPAKWLPLTLIAALLAPTLGAIVLWRRLLYRSACLRRSPLGERTKLASDTHPSRGVPPHGYGIISPEGRSARPGSHMWADAEGGTKTARWARTERSLCQCSC